MAIEQFRRSELVLSAAVMDSIAQKRVIIFGVGGVGSWCAESLVRTGFCNITLVDFDVIVNSNVNRQLHATSATIGKHKTTVLRVRLLEINPDAQIFERIEMYTADNSSNFNLHSYDIIVDAIDSAYSKLHLIREACKTDAFFISSMGAAGKIDAQSVKVQDFWSVQFCLFARRLRKMMRKGEIPTKKFLCVYSTEQREDCYEVSNVDGEAKRINGSLVHVTATFGFTIASEICKYVYNLEQVPNH